MEEAYVLIGWAICGLARSQSVHRACPPCRLHAQMLMLWLWPFAYMHIVHLRNLFVYRC